MPIFSRKYTLDELIAEFRDTMTQEGRVACPVTAYLEHHRDTWSIDDAEQWIATDPAYGPATCADIVRTAGSHNAPEVTAEIQRLYAGYLVAFPWKIARLWIEKLMHADIPHGLDSTALKLLVDHIAANHPNPKAFLGKADVLAKLPVEMEITSLACPNFQGFQSAELRGRGSPHPKGATEAFGVK